MRLCYSARFKFVNLSSVSLQNPRLIPPFEYFGLKGDIERPMAIIDSAAVAAITAPHLLYAFIWFMPDLWRKVFPKPIRAFQLSASILKGKRYHMPVTEYSGNISIASSYTEKNGEYIQKGWCACSVASSSLF